MTTTTERIDAGGITPEVHTEDSLTYARTIQHGLAPRERRALATVYENMPCSVAAVARITETSRRTAHRACEALQSEAVALIQRTEAGLIVHPGAVGAVDAWAHRFGSQSDIAEWWKSAPVLDGRGFPQDDDSEPWPDDVFPEPEFDPLPPDGDIDLAMRPMESRRSPIGRGTFISFPILNYVAVTKSLQAAKVALECGRRATRSGIAEFDRGEIAKATAMSTRQVTDALAQMRKDGIASSATTTRVELDLRDR